MWQLCDTFIRFLHEHAFYWKQLSDTARSKKQMNEKIPIWAPSVLVVVFKVRAQSTCTLCAWCATCSDQDFYNRLRNRLV